MSTDDGTPPGTVERHGFWQRTLRMWDLVFAGMTTVYVVAVLVGAPDPAAARVPLASMAVLALAYVLLGRRAAQRGDARLADTYLVVLVVVIVVQVATGDIGSALLFLAFHQIWYFSRRRVAGVLWSVGLTAGITVAAVLRVEATGPRIAEIAAQFAVALLFAVVLGLWITQVSEQSEVRAYLLEELRATQDALAASHHAAGVVAERERLAAEIHDTLAQGFTSVVMLAQTAGVELERGHTARAAVGLARIEDVARDNLAEARALVAAWTPPDLQDGDIAGALRRIAGRFTAESGTAVEVVDDADGTASGPPIGPEAQVVLLRAAQESLANVRRHAGATRVTLHLTRSDGATVLEVDDDGRGVAAGVREGTGLRGMRARAEAVGGRLDVGGAPDGGTRVRVSVPAWDAAGSVDGTRDRTDGGSPDDGSAVDAVDDPRADGPGVVHGCGVDGPARRTAGSLRPDPEAVP